MPAALLDYKLSGEIKILLGKHGQFVMLKIPCVHRAIRGYFVAKIVCETQNLH